MGKWGIFNLQIFVGSLFCVVVLGALSGLTIILLRWRGPVALLWLYYGCLYSVVFLEEAVGWSAVVIVAVPGHTHFLSAVDKA